MRPRRGRPLFIIDIAVPRDVEAAAGEIEQVFLYNIDDLQASVRENLARRASEVARAEAIVDEELEKFGDVAAVARRHPDRRRAAAVVRGDSPRRARSARLQALGAAARSPRGSAGARRRDHAPAGREAAAHAHRTAQVACRSRDGGAVRRKRSSRVFGLADPAEENSGSGLGTRSQRPAPTIASSRSPAPSRAPVRAFALTVARVPGELRIGTRGSQLALWQANTVARTSRLARRASLPHRRHQDDAAISFRIDRCPRSAASGCSSRKSKTRCCETRSTSPCTAARTCRRCCPTA